MNRKVDTEKVLNAIKVLYPDHRLGKITVEWMSDDELLEVNKTHLDHDYYTDIITFDYSRGRRISGELLISYDRVKDNAVSMNVPVEQEEFRVVAHGILHLLGFKDKTEEEAAVMRSKENEVLKALGYGS